MQSFLENMIKIKEFLSSRIHLDPSSNSFKLVVLVILFVILSYLINYFLLNSIFGRGYRIFVAPGIILHEFAHALLCILTGAKITRISFFDKDGGSVQHGPSKIPVVGPILISLAPFVFGLAAIFYLSKVVGMREVDLSAVHLSYDSVINFIRSVFSQIDFHSWRNLFILYLTLSVVVTMTPSGQDLRNISLILILLGIIGFLLLRYTHFSFSLGFLPLAKIIILLNTVAVLLILALLLSIVIFGVSKLIKR